MKKSNSTTTGNIARRPFFIVSFLPARVFGLLRYYVVTVRLSYHKAQEAGKGNTGDPGAFGTRRLLLSLIVAYVRLIG